jgi:hypothetical protein
MRKVIFLISISAISLSFMSDNDELINDSKKMDGNNISTWFRNNGIFNQQPGFGIGGFEWPKGSNKFARYSSGIQLGGIVNGDTLVAICDYTSEYFPGYTDNAGMPQGNETPEYKIYKMVYEVNDSDRYQWPNVLLGNSDQGAPVYFDSVSQSYMPNDFANQTMFYSNTDSYTQSHIHYAGSTDPFKADIKQINYSFNQPEELKNVIYQEYRIINRSNKQWTDFYINLYSDDDLGDPSNDAAGIDTFLNVAYTYNFSPTDNYYGSNPPAVGFAIMRAPLVYSGNSNDTVFYYEGKNKRQRIGFKEMKLKSTVIYLDDSWQPNNYKESYNALRGLKNDGTSYINPTTGQPTKFVYSGNPVTGAGWYQSGGYDVRFYQGFGPITMNPGDTQIIVVAQIIAQSNNNLNSITKLREATLLAKQYYDDLFSNVTIGINQISTTIPENFHLSQNYPNPFNPTTNIRFQIPESGFVTLKVFDITGREVAMLVNEQMNAGEYNYQFSTDEYKLSSGVYFYRLTTNDKNGKMNFSQTKKMVVVR